MKLHTLQPAKGSVKGNKRVGRGQGSGRGGTSTRGHKGAKSRSGYSSKSGFEGGQMPLQRRVPKFGFNNPNKVVFKAVNLDDLQKLSEKIKSENITIEVLIDNGIVGKRDVVKILGRGEIKSKLNISAHSFSQSVAAAVEKAGGSITKI